jgi:uncharacterized membrane protein YgdD (TMEM256/DUF423 family)
MNVTILIGGVTGLLGVAASAYASYGPVGPQLAIAANFLLFHAPVFLALAALQGREGRCLSQSVTVTTLLALGLALFCGDLALRATLGHGLFSGAAPLGGGALMLGWAGMIVSAIRHRI